MKANFAPTRVFLAFGSDWVRQQSSEKEWRTFGNFLIKHDVTPQRFQAGVEANPCRDRFFHCLPRKKPTHEPIQPRCTFVWHTRSGYQVSHPYFNIVTIDHSNLPCRSSAETIQSAHADRNHR